MPGAKARTYLGSKYKIGSRFPVGMTARKASAKEKEEADTCGMEARKTKGRRG
jgi:hypothetical protein